MSNPFIENQDLLLSCTLPDQNEFSFLTEQTPDAINPSSFISLDLNEQKDIKDEIIDFDIFDILQQQMPDIAGIVESVSAETPCFLPQISVNTTAKLLDTAFNNETNHVVSLADSDEKEIMEEIKHLNPLTMTPTTPTRVSMRLVKKKKPYADEIYEEPKRSRSKNVRSNKRKLSFDDEIEELKQEEFDVNFDDSMFNDDSCSMNSYDSKSEFPRFRSKRLDSKDLLDPIKKESNKEAATRYRNKKSAERESLFQTKVKLEKDNDQIKQRIELVQIEISYLKNMLVQTLLNKGVLNNSGSEIF